MAAYYIVFQTRIPLVFVILGVRNECIYTTFLLPSLFMHVNVCGHAKLCLQTLGLSVCD